MSFRAFVEPSSATCLPSSAHSVFLCTAALEGCGHMQEEEHIVYLSEKHISEDFELMMKFIVQAMADDTLHTKIKSLRRV